MTNFEKSETLRNEIEKQLLPLINGDYVLWDCPYYSNIGDVLIWEGELSFLQKLNFKCLDFASVHTCRFPKLSDDTVILLQGGGNFGDLWRGIQEFRLKVIEKYPDNRIIIFPQSVCYSDHDLVTKDAKIMSGHRHLTICARDRKSYDFLKVNFQNEILLLPDMAFCISSDYLQRVKGKETDKTLFLKREDKECGNIPDSLATVSGKTDVRDWPFMKDENLLLRLVWKMGSLQRMLRAYPVFSLLAKIIGCILDFCMLRLVKPYLLVHGVRFVSSYRNIYTTRLHVMILAVLLNKPVTFLDNSYGKNSAFYETWLRDLPEVKKVGE